MRSAPSRSLTPNSGAMTTTLNGTVAIKMPASDELIHCSPIAMSENGMTSSATANAVTAALCANALCSAPRCHAIGTSTMAASVMRPHATHTGDRSCRASLMKKYGRPQIAHKAANVTQARHVIGAGRYHRNYAGPQSLKDRCRSPA
jgi:hypothetical protein